MNTILFAAGIGQGLAGFLMFFTSLFLILLVLVQRGRGGGLSGAFGGMGGSSAFGAKAGDTFTKITIVASAVWILICMISVWGLGNSNANSTILTDGPDVQVQVPADGGQLDLSDLTADAATSDDATPASDAATTESDAATTESDAAASDDAAPSESVLEEAGADAVPDDGEK